MKKNKYIVRIERISKFLLLGSLIAMLLGLGYICKGAVELIIGLNAGFGRAEYGEFIILIAEGIVLLVHYFFVSRFFITALKAEVPFTHEAAKEMRVIGWESIILPLLVVLIGIILFHDIKPFSELIKIEIYELVLGVFLIQTGYVIDYATEKTTSGHRHHVMCNLIEEKYPDIFREIETETDQIIKNDPKMTL